MRDLHVAFVRAPTHPQQAVVEKYKQAKWVGRVPSWRKVSKARTVTVLLHWCYVPVRIIGLGTVYFWCVILQHHTINLSVSRVLRELTSCSEASNLPCCYLWYYWLYSRMNHRLLFWSRVLMETWCFVSSRACLPHVICSLRCNNSDGFALLYCRYHQVALATPPPSLIGMAASH